MLHRWPSGKTYMATRHTLKFFFSSFFPSSSSLALLFSCFSENLGEGDASVHPWLINVYLFWSPGQWRMACDPAEPRPRCRFIVGGWEKGFGLQTPCTDPRTSTHRPSIQPTALLQSPRGFHCFTGNNSVFPCREHKLSPSLSLLEIPLKLYTESYPKQRSSSVHF